MTPSASSRMSSSRVDRRRLLDLGEQRRPAADQLARLGDVLGPLHEGLSADPVDADARARTRDRLRSLSVSAGIGSTTSGTLTPLLFGDLAADHRPRSRSRSGDRSVTCRRILPSLTSSRCAGARALRRSRGCGRSTAGRVARRSVEVEAEGCALCEHHRARRRRCRRAASAPAGRRGSRSGGRIPSRARGSPRCRRGDVVVGAVAHVEPEGVGARPANRLRIISGVSVAGPSVARILTLRLRGDELGRHASPFVAAWRHSG